MLAYLFWHRPQPGTPFQEYESSLTQFHAKLVEAAPGGFLASATYRIGPTPWLDEQAGYEDWYLLEGSWALDTLNRAAVAGPMEAAHAAVAGPMATGYGGLYSLVSGQAVRAERSAVAWLMRPRGIRYEPVLEDLCARLAGQVSAWRRQMVLSPAPEFALVSGPEFTPTLPAGWHGRVVERRAVWLSPRLGLGGSCA